MNILLLIILAAAFLVVLCAVAMISAGTGNASTHKEIPFGQYKRNNEESDAGK